MQTVNRIQTVYVSITNISQIWFVNVAEILTLKYKPLIVYSYNLSLMNKHVLIIYNDKTSELVFDS